LRSLAGALVTASGVFIIIGAFAMASDVVFSTFDGAFPFLGAVFALGIVDVALDRDNGFFVPCDAGVLRQSEFGLESHILGDIEATFLL
jgi:hypothetical protein